MHVMSFFFYPSFFRFVSSVDSRLSGLFDGCHALTHFARTSEISVPFTLFSFFLRVHTNSICPGKELADNSIWMSIAMALALFKITKPVEASTGRVIEPVVEMLTGIIS